MTRRASARPDDITDSGNSLKLPALNSTAVEDFVCCFVHFVRLVCLNEFLHILSIFIVFTSHDQVYVRRIFIFNKDTVFSWGQADLAGVGRVDDRQCDLRIVQWNAAAAALPVQPASGFSGFQSRPARSAADQHRLSV